MRKSRSHEATQERGAVSPPRFASQAVLPPCTPHEVEQAVQRELLAQPALHFASLVVRRIDNGVLLQGVVEADDELPDVCRIARRVSGVHNVVNRLVIAPRHAVPVSG